MAKLFSSLAVAAALSAISFSAEADPSANMTPIAGFPRRCSPGAQTTCSCDDGAPGTATCNPNGINFSVCVCAKVNVNVPKPVVVVPKAVVDIFAPRPQVQATGPRVPRVRRAPSPPMPGLVLLLGGACTLGTGAFNLWFGIDRIRDYGKDPFGIVSVSLGGTAMLVGLPLTIVGIVRYAQEPKEADKEKEEKDTKSTGFQFAPTANGFAIHF